MVSQIGVFRMDFTSEESREGRKTELDNGFIRITWDYFSPPPPPSDSELTTGRRIQRTELPLFRLLLSDGFALPSTLKFAFLALLLPFGTGAQKLPSFPTLSRLPLKLPLVAK